MLQIDLPLLGTTPPSVMPREPDVVLKDVLERVALKCIGSFTNSHVITAHRQLDVQKVITFNLKLMQLAQTHVKMLSELYSLLGKDSFSPILPELDHQCAASALCTFFEEKIQTIRTGLEAEENSSESRWQDSVRVFTLK